MIDGVEDQALMIRGGAEVGLVEKGVRDSEAGLLVTRVVQVAAEAQQT